MDTQSLIAFLAWSTVLNVGILLIATITLIAFRTPLAKLHGTMFGLSKTQISQQYFSDLSRYKIAVIVFNVVPYPAHKLMA